MEERRYFIAIFGGADAGAHPVKGGCYPVPLSYWNHYCPAGMYKGDRILLYCTATYPGNYRVSPGIGEVTHTKVHGDGVFV